MTETLVKVEGVSKKFCRNLKRSIWYGIQDLGGELIGRANGGDGKLRNQEFWAIKDITFELNRGECLGLIGRNGAGKTTLLRILNGLIKPDAGRIEMRGRVGALIALGAGFNPVLTGRENIYVNGSVLGLTTSEISKRLDDIVDFSELSEFMDTPVQAFSSGMVVRLGFAIATAMDPDVLLMDEILAVGDMHFQAKCHNRVAQLKRNGVACILVTHNMHHVARFCDSGLLLRRHEQSEKTDVQTAISTYCIETLPDSPNVSASIYSHPDSKITFDKARFSSSDASNIVECQNGTPVSVVIPYSTTELVPQPVIEIVLRLDDGTPFVYFTNKDEPKNTTPLQQSAQLVISFESLPANNIYLNLSIAVWDSSNHELLHWQQSIARLFVHGKAASIALTSVPGKLSQSNCYISSKAVD